MSDKPISDAAIKQLEIFGTEESGDLSPLLKPPHSKNITLADWNELIHSSDRSFADVRRVYDVLKKTLPELENYTTEQVAAILTTIQAINTTLGQYQDGLTTLNTAFSKQVDDVAAKFDAQSTSINTVFSAISRLDAVDVAKISVEDTDRFGVYTLRITFNDSSSVSTEFDLPLEAVQIASVDDYVSEDGKRYLEIRFVDENIAPLNIELDEIFGDLGTLVADKLDAGALKWSGTSLYRDSGTIKSSWTDAGFSVEDSVGQGVEISRASVKLKANKSTIFGTPKQEVLIDGGGITVSNLDKGTDVMLKYPDLPDGTTVTLATLNDIPETGGGSSAVQSVNGKTGEVVLNASDVGARPSTWTPTPAEVGARPATWMPTYADVGADQSGAASSAVGSHNVNGEAHNDIRLLINELSARINTLANSDDVDLDQMKELVTYIKANRGLIEEITTNKISYSDIVDNLTTNTSSKPLSAAQGVALKALLDGLSNSKLDSSALNTAIATALAQAKASGEFDGKAGVGIASVVQTTTSTADGGSNIITVTKTDGTSSAFTVRNGSKGSPGTSVTVSNVSQNTTPGGESVVTFSDGKTVTVKNGTNGTSGTSVTVSNVNESAVSGGTSTVTFSDGKKINIKNGKDGANGSNYTLTDADRDQIANLVITKLGGEPVFGYVDDNNNIVVQGNLPDGTYSVKYEMENGSKVNIGNLVIDSNVYYSVTKNLTNCTINNSATEAIGGKSYSATITANSGYELKSVSVTMGGVNVSVTNGVINIANVTGNIVITAVAEVNKPAYTNLFVPSEAQINKRVSNSLELKDVAGHFATAFIDVSGKTPFTDATKIYIKGANFNASSSGTNQTKILTYASKPASGYSGNYSVIQGNNISPTNEGNGVISVSNIAASFAGSVKYMVLTLKVSDSTLTTADIQNIVITIDEPIN